MSSSPTIRPPSIYKQGNAPDQQSGFINPIPWTDDLWVDIVNHLVKRCTAMNPYVWVSIEGGGGGGNPTFDQIQSGTNVTANMLVGTGSTLGFTGSGVLNASEINGITATNTPSHAGEVLISQPGNTTATWADPLVQGIQANATAAATINPVLVSGAGPDTNQHQLSVDNSGNLNVNVLSGGGSNASVGTTGAAVPASATQVGGSKAGNLTALVLDGSSNLNVNINASTATVPVSLASTTVTNTVAENLTQVGGAAVTLGAKTSANSIPVVLASDEATLPVSLASTTITGNVTVVQPAGTNLHVITDTGSTTAVTGTVTVAGTVTANQGAAPWQENVTQFGSSAVVTGTGISGAGIPRVTVSSDSFPATQAISGTVTANAGSGTFTTQDTADGIVGNAASATAQQMAGRDQNNQLRVFQTDSSGQLTISPASGIQDLLYQLILETRATRLAIIAMANGGGPVNYADFDVNSLQDYVAN